MGRARGGEYANGGADTAGSFARCHVGGGEVCRVDDAARAGPADALR
jgi:hypothetical protein